MDATAPAGLRRCDQRKHSNTLARNINFTMLVSLTVGKVDAGVAVLLTEDKRLVSVHQPLTIPSHPSIYP